MNLVKKTATLLSLLLSLYNVFPQCNPTSLNGNQVIIANTTWVSGTYNISGDFTVNTGVTLTITYNNNCPFIVNANNISILGTINADGAGAIGGNGGNAGSSSGGAGGSSTATGGTAGTAGNGNGGGLSGTSGGAASGGCSIDCGNFICSGGNDADRAGGGGAGSGAGGSYGAAGGNGGSGANGRVENVPSNSHCNSVLTGGSGGNGNSALSAYGNSTNNTDLQTGSGGAGGGGGGGGYANGTAGGNGGKGGGAVNLNATADLIISGIISANGTNGGAGGNGGIRSGGLGDWNCENCGNGNGGGANDCRNASLCGACTYYTWGWPGGSGGGAGGGSGGGIKIQAVGNLNLTGTLLTNGGAGGNAGRPWQSMDGACNNLAAAGGPGSGGVIKYVYNPCANNVFAPASIQANSGTAGIASNGISGSNTAAAGVIYNETVAIYDPGYSPLPAPSASSNQILCGTGLAPADISATSITGGIGSYTYQWYYSTTNAVGQSGSVSVPASGWNTVAGATGTLLSSSLTGTLSTTTYYQLELLSGPCTAWSNVVSVTVASIPAISNVTISDALCNGGNSGSITLNVSGGTLPFTYSSNGGVNYQSSNVLGGLAPGSYNLYVKDINNCSSAYASNPVTVDEPAALSMTDSAVNATCASLPNGSVSVTLVTGGVSPYLYSLNGGPLQNGNVFISLLFGDYLVRVTDNNGCVDTMTAVIGNNYNVTAALDSATNVFCFAGNNGAASVSMTGGVNPYLYSSNGVTFQSSPTLTGLIAGSYTATIIDNNGCSATTQVHISEPSALVIQIDSSVSVPCASVQVGKLFTSISGGTAGYTFHWSNNDSTQNITNLTAGSFTVTATDRNSCTATASGIVNSLANFTTSVTAYNASCSGTANGSASVAVLIGNGPYGYLWTSGGTSDSISNLTAGVYSVTVSDVANCSVTASVTVNQPTAVNVQTTTVQPSCVVVAGSAVANVTGGTAPYSFSWSNGSAIDSANNLTVGYYTLTVLDAHNCSAIGTVTIINSVTLSVGLLTVSDSCFGEQHGVILAEVNGGAIPYTYLWSNGGSTGYLDNLAAGNYSLTVTDINNCSATASTIITQPNQLMIFTSNTGDLNAQGNGTATVDSITGGTAPYTITGWSNGESGNHITGLAAGTYTVTVTDENGCEQTIDVVVNVISGINDLNNDLMFEIYPNPARTEINISVNILGKTGLVYASVKDVLGHLLLTKTINALQTKIDISLFADGVYLIELKRGNSKAVKQIIVSK